MARSCPSGWPADCAQFEAPTDQGWMVKSGSLEMKRSQTQHHRLDRIWIMFLLKTCWDAWVVFQNYFYHDPDIPKNVWKCFTCSIIPTWWFQTVLISPLFMRKISNLTRICSHVLKPYHQLDLYIGYIWHILIPSRAALPSPLCIFCLASRVCQATSEISFDAKHVFLNICYS